MAEQALLLDMPQKQANGSQALMAIIERAAFLPDFDPAKLRELFELKLKYEAEESRRDFVAALNAFKMNPPRLEKVKKVDFTSKSGSTVKYNYAPLDHICKEIGAALSRQGLSFRWDVEQKDSGIIKVTCTLQHCSGHSEKVTIEAPPHDDQRMNVMQRLACTVTYLERYTLLAITGLATEEQDTDGNAVTMGELSEQVEWIENAANPAELKKLYEQAYRKFTGNPNAQKAIIAAKDRKKLEFTQ